MTSHTLFNGDSRFLTNMVDSNSIDLIVTSPPYHVGKEYEKNVSWQDHLDMIDDVLGECRKVLKLHRVICWNIAHSPQRNVPAYHALALEKHFTFVDDIVWRKQSGNSKRFGNFVQCGQYYPNTNWEHIFVYAKEKPIVKVDNSDMNFALQYRDDLWEGISPQGSDVHPAPFPEKLVEPLIRLYSNPGDTILDPFCGSGTTMKVARDFERNSVGVEKSNEYCDIIKKRVGFLQQSLGNSIEYSFHIT